MAAVDVMPTLDTTQSSSASTETSSPDALSSLSATASEAGGNHDGEEPEIDSSEVQSLVQGKMLSVLRHMGYDDTAVSKVDSLIQRNLVQVSATEEKKAVETAVSDLLTQEGGVKVNSNEPVLFIALDSESISTSPSGAETIAGLRDSVLHVLRESWNIKPVRVYLCKTALADSTASFVLTLLNVVNTEIGGPSMVQLLDAAFHDESWKRFLLSKEAWRERDLLWRDDEGLRSLTSVTSAAVPAESVAPESVQEVVQDDEADRYVKEVLNEGPESTFPHESLVEGLPESSVQGWKSAESFSHENEKDVEPDVEEEHPEYKQLEELEKSRGFVQHPTWTHADESDSLIDIIRGQASKAKQDGSDEEESEPVVKRREEDEFELV